MGIWGVLNSLLLLKFWAPKFYKRAEEVLAEIEKKGE